MKLPSLMTLTIALTSGLLLSSCQTTGTSMVPVDPDPRAPLRGAAVGHPYSLGFQAGAQDGEARLRARPTKYSQKLTSREARAAFNRGYMKAWNQARGKRTQKMIRPSTWRPNPNLR